MNRTAWLVIISLCVFGLGAIVVLSKKDETDVSQLNAFSILGTDSKNKPEAIGDHVYGNAKAKVVVYEYADFQCGGCAAANQQLPAVKERYKEKVAFVFRNFPLTNGHPNALAAATVAEAAGLQGKYWEMNNLLYSSQSEWSSLSAEQRTSAFEQYATQLGLNLDTFREDLKKSSIQEKIRTDRALGNKVSVTATPTLYINDQKVNDEITSKLINASTDEFTNALDTALKNAGETPPAR